MLFLVSGTVEKRPAIAKELGDSIQKRSFFLIQKFRKNDSLGESFAYSKSFITAITFFPSLDSLLEMDPSGKALGVGRILKIFPFPPQNFKTVDRSHSKFQCISHLKPHFPQNVNDKVINNLSFLPHTFDKICFSNANDDDRPTFQVIGTFYLLDPSSASSSQGITHTHNLEEQMLPHHNPKPTNNTQSQGKKFLHDEQPTIQQIPWYATKQEAHKTTSPDEYILCLESGDSIFQFFITCSLF